MIKTLKEMVAAEETIIELQEELRKLRIHYSELVMAVKTKIPDEGRHETALRYIQQAEQPDDEQCKEQPDESKPTM